MKKNRIRASIKNEFMNPDELGRYLGFKRRTIYAKLASREIPGVKLFGSWRFRKSDIDEWVKSRLDNMRKEMEGKWKRKRKSS